MSPRWNWDSPTPSLASECAPPPWTKGWGAHSCAGEGLGQSQFQRLEKKLSTLPTLWYTPWVQFYTVHWFPWVQYQSDFQASDSVLYWLSHLVHLQYIKLTDLYGTYITFSDFHQGSTPQKKRILESSRSKQQVILLILILIVHAFFKQTLFFNGKEISRSYLKSWNSLFCAFRKGNIYVVIRTLGCTTFTLFVKFRSAGKFFPFSYDQQTRK